MWLPHPGPPWMFRADHKRGQTLHIHWSTKALKQLTGEVNNNVLLTFTWRPLDVHPLTTPPNKSDASPIHGSASMDWIYSKVGQDNFVHCILFIVQQRGT